MKKLLFLLFVTTVMGVYAQQIDMLRIEGGTFTMGSPAGEQGRSAREGPQHQVTVGSFYMGRYPVTQAEYEDVMGSNPSSFRGANLPVEQVSWFDAVEFCNRLSLKEGLTPAYTVNGTNVSWDTAADGYRLPTEAEWEYACRAGTQTPFYSGASVDAAGWHSGNSGRTTHPVGQKEPNSWGLYDMHGNVFEWCWDWLRDYPYETQTQGPPAGTDRVYRGGSYYYEAHQLRSAFRFGNRPTLRTFFTGFRLVRSAI